MGENTVKAKLNDIELYYEIHGKGDPIIFIHGWADDCSIWKHYIESFARKYKVIVYDHRGHGRSDKPEGNYSIKTLANDLYALTQRLDLGKVTLVGHSMGGMTVLVFALDHPNVIQKLVLVGACAKMPILNSIMGIMRYIIPYKKFLRLSQKSGYYKPSEQLIKRSMDMAMNTSKYAAYESLKEMTQHYDIRREVSNIEVPTLIIVGEKDKNMPVTLSQYLNKEIKGSILQVIANSGHTVMVEKPNEFGQALEKFIG